MSLRALIIITAFLLAPFLFCGCCTPYTAPQATQADAMVPASSAQSPRILATVPDVRQSTPYSCGAASLQAVLNYWGKDMREDELRALLNTTEEGGTPPENIVNVSRMLGFYAEMRTNLSLSDLEAAVNAGMPVIVGTQAWRGNTSQQSWVNDWADGHYMVVIGLDGRNVYLEDPAMLGTRGVIPRDEFLTRWHDFRGPGATDPGSIIYRRLAVFVRGEAPADYPVFTYVG